MSEIDFPQIELGAVQLDQFQGDANNVIPVELANGQHVGCETDWFKPGE